MSILGRVFVLAAALFLVTACGGSFGGSADVSFTVSASTTGNGSGTISPGSTIVPQGSTTSFAINTATGSTIANVSGCGGSLNGSTYTTGPINSACQVVATLNLARYLVTTAAGAGGSISPAAVNVDHGSTATFTITPDSGRVIDSVSGCDGSLNGSTYTTGPITSACQVVATFDPVSYTVTASAGTGGSISPSAVNVAHGSTTTFTVTPDSGKVIDSVSGCGGSLSGSTYTTGPITAACTVTASFRDGVVTPPPPETFTVTTATTGDGSGTITPGSATVEEGQTASFTLTPATGSALESIAGCGGSLSGNIYTTGPITANCLVVASFMEVPTPPRRDFLVTTTIVGNGTGTITPKFAIVRRGRTTTFQVVPAAGSTIASVTGCGGSLDGTTYTTGRITSDCTVIVTFSTLAELLGGMYDGVMTSSMSLYSTDSTTITFAVDGYDAEITKDAYLGRTCLLDGSLAGTEFPLSGSGTFQCSDFTAGTWSSDKITRTNETALLSEITMMTGDEVYTIKMSGFRAAPAVNYDPALDYWETGVGFGQFVGRYEGSMQSLDACANLSFPTSPTGLVISVTGNHIVLEQEAFFAGSCRFEGEIDAFDGGVIAASGHFQCANSDQGIWQSPHLVLTGADSIFAELLVTVPGRGCSYTAKYLGFRSGGPDLAPVDPEPSVVTALER